MGEVVEEARENEGEELKEREIEEMKENEESGRRGIEG